MSERTVIPTRAHEALRQSNDTRYKSRVNQLWEAKEYAFALLVIWCQIETRLKLIRYHDKIKDGWPDKLNFIRKTWGPLARLAAENVDYYAICFEGNRSMWQQRNQIAHAAISIDKAQAEPLREASEWLLSMLDGMKPTRDALLQKKRKSDAQIHRKPTGAS
ncbi:hypothetical protein [Aeromonas rivipollensis]|uniref:hypothetical protein n=1 Tax=Aeromonas TaxID=642 RepID=UPI0038CFCA67